MKLPNRLLGALSGAFGARLIQLLGGSLRIHTSYPQSSWDPLRSECTRSYIFICWHEFLFLPAYVYGKCRPFTLISQSQDGEYISQILQRLGWRVIRGSSSRGGMAAVRNILKLIRAGETSHLALPVDGPRGPRQVIKPGAIYLSSKTGMPIVPTGIAYQRPWRANSWDRFALPRPLSGACLVSGVPIAVPPSITSDDMAMFRFRVQREMDRLGAEAERHLASRTQPARFGKAA